ncbi:MAG: hypothetical protein JWM74_4286 [Myxococcaceae bacterium]|jgi:hypothetical protein|nr:hypothetical protein [Myxococcaceae bacterium]
MTSAKLIAVTLALTLLPKACGKKDEAADAAPATVETAATPTATETETTPSATTTATVKPVVKPVVKDGGVVVDAGPVVADAGPAKDAGAVGDAGGKVGFLPPKVDAPAQGNKDEKGTAFGHYDQAVIIAKVHTRDPMLEACYKATGKDPGAWDSRCYDMAFTAEGLVTAATTRSQDPLGTCSRAALTGIILGAPKDKAAGQARVCLSTR